MLPVPMDRTSGRRSSSIGCRSIVGRRTSVYITSANAHNCDPFKLIVEINSQVALFRDLLIHIGQSKDCPELREKVRKLRRSCVEACKHTSQLILPQTAASKSTINLCVTADEATTTTTRPSAPMPADVVATHTDADGLAVISLTVPTTMPMTTTSTASGQSLAPSPTSAAGVAVDQQPATAGGTTVVTASPLPAGSVASLAEGNPNVLLLFCLAQLLLRELFKSHRLIQVVPMDMSGYYDNRAGPSNLGSVISQILLCKQITPDFNQEELCSIAKDSQEIAKILADMQEHLPLHDVQMEKTVALTGEEQNGPWPAKRRRNSIYKNMGLLCCVSRPNYL